MKILGGAFGLLLATGFALPASSDARPETLSAAQAAAKASPPAAAADDASKTDANKEPKKTVAKKKEAKKKGPPFYEKYLSSNAPLDVAIRQAERRAADDPDSPPVHNDLGNLLARRGFAKEALAEYARASRLDREFFLADYNAGLLYEKEGKDEHAINAFRRSIRRKPGFPPSRFHLGMLYERRGQERAAVEEYSKALRIDDSLRQPSRNPLVVQTRLLYRVSLKNYPRDLAAATQETDMQFAQPELYRHVALDRPVDTAEVTPAEPAEEAMPPVSPARWAPSASGAPQIVPKNTPQTVVTPQRKLPAKPMPPAAIPARPTPAYPNVPGGPSRTFVPPPATPGPPAPPPNQTPAEGQDEEEAPPSGQ